MKEVITTRSQIIESQDIYIERREPRIMSTESSILQDEKKLIPGRTLNDIERM